METAKLCEGANRYEGMKVEAAKLCEGAKPCEGTKVEAAKLCEDVKLCEGICRRVGMEIEVSRREFV